MATRKIRKDATLGAALKKLGIKKQVLKSPTGRATRKDAKIGTLRKRSGSK
jgi:hypothetical protein